MLFFKPCTLFKKDYPFRSPLSPSCWFYKPVTGLEAEPETDIYVSKIKTP